ncbi:MAG: MBL fold metallo-hydrolase [Deltaproteobacteria bacterium]|nr:MBL fold metallo-hydrolase [Deltaproteobacteria bacterium]
MKKSVTDETIPSPITLTVLYNNVPHDTRLETAWGMACLVETPERTILFDTGGDGRILLSNMRKLGKEPKDVEAVVLSHIDGDHVGGLLAFLEENADITIYVPASFPDDFEQAVNRAVIRVDSPQRIEKGMYSTGEMGARKKEQALILRTCRGLVVVTGCSHPGIVEIVERATAVCKSELYLVLGGFHLADHPEQRVKGIIAQLQQLGVEKVGPSHCTGERPISLFKAAWAKNFMELGCGATTVIDSASNDAMKK